MKISSELADASEVRLDLKDKKMLLELDFNARLPYSELARRIGLSKQGAEYKLNNLVKKGVIRGFYPVVNVPRLGYTYCRLFVTLQNMTEEQHHKITQYLIGHPQVFWLFKMHGMYDLLIVIWVKRLEDFRAFKEDLECRFSGHIKHALASIVTDVIHFQHRWILGQAGTREIHLKEAAETTDIDALDTRIITALCDDARLPLVEIASRVGESAKVVGNRIRKLEERGLIGGYRPVINHATIGFTYYKVFVNLNAISQSELKRLKAHIKASPHVIYLVEGIGLPVDLDIELMVKSNQQLYGFIEDLRFKFPALIGEYQTVIFVDTLKVKYWPF